MIGAWGLKWIAIARFVFRWLAGDDARVDEGAALRGDSPGQDKTSREEEQHALIVCGARAVQGKPLIVWYKLGRRGGLPSSLGTGRAALRCSSCAAAGPGRLVSLGATSTAAFPAEWRVRE